MYFLYVDESGDIGLKHSPTKYFCLSGFVVHELCWHDTLKSIIDFRKYLRKTYGLKLREEVHAGHLIHKPGVLRRIEKSLRLRILKDVIDFQAELTDVNIINVVVKKQGKDDNFDIFEAAWTTLIQRFHNTISYRNFPGPQNPDDRGILIVDQTDEIKLRNLSRRIRKYNPVPSMYDKSYFEIPITSLVEDAAHRNSAHSYFIQLCDVNAYFLYQKFEPCEYIKRKGARNYFKRLDTILCKVASKSDPEGIVIR